MKRRAGQRQEQEEAEDKEENSMTLAVEKEYDRELDFDFEKTAKALMEAVLDQEECPYEAEVNLLLTSDEEIHRINREFRQIDRVTDVLSFPMLSLETPSDFSRLEEHTEDNFNPDTGELSLGDIIISIDKIYEQAQKYNHSILREFSFLFVHSMLHLVGYDHLLPEESAVMEEKQRQVLDGLKIFR